MEAQSGTRVKVRIINHHGRRALRTALSNRMVGLRGPVGAQHATPCAARRIMNRCEPLQLAATPRLDD